MPSSVNDIHHHPSDSFVTFSTGATGQPQDHIPRTRTSPRRLGGTLSSHLKCLGDISACFTHTHTDTHTPTNYLGGPKTGIVLHIFKLHQTKKQRKLKQIGLRFERLLKYFCVKFLYIAMTLSFVICCSRDSLMLKRGRTFKRKNNNSNNNNNSIT